MRSYVITSLGIHALAFWLWLGPSLFSGARVPWGSSYKIDFLGGPSGSSGVPGAKVEKEEKESKAEEDKKDKKSKDTWKIDKKGESSKDEKASKDSKKESSKASKSGAGGAGSGTGIGVGFGAGSGLENFPYAWYINILRTRLWEQWGSPGGEDAVQIAKVRFVIEKSGKVSNVKLEESSGAGAYDQLALRAVAYASPFPPLPADYPKPNLTVHVEFRVKP